MNTSKKFIQSAIEHPGSLRRWARTLGLLRGHDTLTTHDLDAMAAIARREGLGHRLRQVQFARTLMRVRR